MPGHYGIPVRWASWPVDAPKAHSVRGPRHSVIKGSTAVMSSDETSAFLSSIPDSNLIGLRDRALIAVMTYSFARVSAVAGLKVEDYFPLKKRWWLRLKEKGGKVNETGCHHKLEAHLDAYIAAAGIAEDKKGPLFRAAIGRTGKLSDRPMSRVDAWYMVRRRAIKARIDAKIGNHSFRAIGITDYMTTWTMAATSPLRSAWPDTPTSKPLRSTTGGAMTSAFVRLREWESEPCENRTKIPTSS